MCCFISVYIKHEPLELSLFFTFTFWGTILYLQRSDNDLGVWFPPLPHGSQGWRPGHLTQPQVPLPPSRLLDNSVLCVRRGCSFISWYDGFSRESHCLIEDRKVTIASSICLRRQRASESAMHWLLQIKGPEHYRKENIIFSFLSYEGETGSRTKKITTSN